MKNFLVIIMCFFFCCSLTAQEGTPYEIIPDTILARDFPIHTNAVFITKTYEGNFEHIWVADIEKREIFLLDSNLNTIRFATYSRLIEDSVPSLQFKDKIYFFAAIGDKLYGKHHHIIYPSLEEPWFNPYMECHLLICNMSNAYTLFGTEFLCKSDDLSWCINTFSYMVNMADSTFICYDGKDTTNMIVIDTLGNKQKNLQRKDFAITDDVDSPYLIGLAPDSTYIKWRYKVSGYTDSIGDFVPTFLTFIPFDTETYELKYTNSITFDVSDIMFGSRSFGRTFKQINDIIMLFIQDTMGFFVGGVYQPHKDIFINFLNLNTGRVDATLTIPNQPCFSLITGETELTPLSYYSGVDYENRDSIYMTFVGLNSMIDSNKVLYVVCFNQDTVLFVKKYIWEGLNSEESTKLTIINGKFFMQIGDQLIKYATNGGVIDTAPQDTSSLVDIATTEELFIFPNPTRENLTILSESTIMQIDLINSKGQIVYTDKANSKTP